MSLLMSKIRIPVFFVLLLLSISVAAAKPLPSLTVKLIADDAVVPGQLLWLRAVIVSRSTSDDIRVALTLPAGVILISGEKISELSLNAHQEKILYYHIQLPLRVSGQIDILVEKGDQPGVYMSASDSFNLNLSPSGVKSREKPSSGRLLDKRGETSLRVMPLHP